MLHLVPSADLHYYRICHTLAENCNSNSLMGGWLNPSLTVSWKDVFAENVYSGGRIMQNDLRAPNSSRETQFSRELPACPDSLVANLLSSLLLSTHEEGAHLRRLDSRRLFKDAIQFFSSLNWLLFHCIIPVDSRYYSYHEHLTELGFFLFCVYH